MGNDDFSWDPPMQGVGTNYPYYPYALRGRAVARIVERVAREGGRKTNPLDNGRPSMPVTACPAFDLELRDRSTTPHFAIVATDGHRLAETSSPGNSTPLTIDGRAVLEVRALATPTTRSDLVLAAGTLFDPRGSSSDGMYEGLDSDLYEIVSGARRHQFLLVASGPRYSVEELMPDLTLVGATSPLFDDPQRARLLYDDLRAIVRDAYAAPWP